MTILVKIEDRGAGLVAVMKESSFGNEFTANAESLENRIANMKRDRRDTSTEEYALAEIRKEGDLSHVYSRARNL